MPPISVHPPSQDILKQLHAAQAAIQAKGAELPWLGNAQNAGVLRVGNDGRGYIGDFDAGTVYWVPSFGAHEVHGAIREKYNSLGAERSYLGYPTSDETSGNDGSRYNTFENGVIEWPDLKGFAYTVPAISIESQPNETGADLHILGSGFTPGGEVSFEIDGLPGSTGPKSVGMTDVGADTKFDTWWNGQFWHTQGTAIFKATDKATTRYASASIEALY